MTAQRDEHEGTLAFAEIALGQIRALSQPATPRNFEIWYDYATGYNAALNRAINQRLEQKGALNEADLEQIYEAHINAARIGDQINTVGSRVLDEIKQVLAMIDAASGSATSYSESLADASQKLAGSSDRETLRLVIERLMEGARTMEVNNKKLEASLSASKQEIEQLQQNLATVRTESLTDPLTGLSNRKYFDAAVAAAVDDAKAKSEPLSLLMADVDYFKLFNDRFGHLTGDQVLRLVATSMKQNVKGQDIAARYGGEEFVIALPNTMLRSAITVADQIRRAVMSKELMKRSSGERLGRVTLSIGVALLRADDTAQSLIARADACLYGAKRNGRNRVICETDPEAEAAAADDTSSARVA
ncbi:MAG: GGDEF domain-containing protein [Xanthobacteraceae bacterium]